MKAKLFRLAVLTFVLASGIEDASAQVYQSNIVGYVNYQFMAGSNLFCNPLLSDDNHISAIFHVGFGSFLPEGTTFSLWNPVTSSFDTNSVFTNGAWSVDLVLPQGVGALLVTPSSFIGTFVGTVLDHNGNHSGGQGLSIPTLFSGPNAIYLLGDKAYGVDVGTNIFLNILGRMPFVGEQVISLSGTSTYLGNGMWDSTPTLGIADAAFLNVMTEPSPLLSIACTNNQAIVSWPFSPSSWTLQTNSDLATGSWGNYAGTIVNNTVTNPPSAGNLFFRLSYP